MKKEDQNESMVIRRGKDGRTMVSAEMALKAAKERAKGVGMGDKKRPITMHDHLKSIMGRFTKNESNDTISFKGYRALIDEAQKFLEDHCSVGDIVTPNSGPHKGIEHTVVATHDDDMYTIVPNVDTEENKYRGGAIKASGSSFVKRVEEVASPFDILKGPGHWKSSIDWTKDDDKYGDRYGYDKKDKEERGITRHRQTDEKPKKDPNEPKKSVGRPKGKYGEYKLNRGDKERAAIGAKVHGNPDRKKNLADTVAIRREFKSAMDKAIRDRQEEIYWQSQEKKTK